MRNTLIFLGGSSLAVAAPDQLTYMAHVRSILSDKCMACYGPDSKKWEANLRLDTFEGETSLLKNDGKLHAAMQHLCGFDPGAFTHKFQGLEFKLTGVKAER